MRARRRFCGWALSAVKEEGMAGGEKLYAEGDARWAGAGGAAKVNVKTTGARATVARLRLAGGAARRSWRVVSPSTLEAGSRVRAGDLLALEPAEGKRAGTAIHAMFAAVEYLFPGPGDEGVDGGGGEGGASAGAWMRGRRRAGVGGGISENA